MPSPSFVAGGDRCSSISGRRCRGHSTAPLQHGEQARLAITLRGVALAGGPVIFAQGEQGRLYSGGLRLDQDAYCRIWNGQITNWNDARLKALNGNVSLQDPQDVADNGVAGWNSTGVEPDETARGIALSDHQTTLLPGEALQTLAPGSFDAITLWHVLEHVHELHSYLDHIRTLLKPGGSLLIAVPNYTSSDAAYYKEY